MSEIRAAEETSEKENIIKHSFSYHFAVAERLITHLLRGNN
jgi:hypothetical protein